MCRVAEIAGIQSPGQCQTGGGFDGDECGLQSAAQPRPQQRNGDAGIPAAAATAAHDIGIVTGLLELAQRLQTDYRAG
jgi:hypothetical protein